MKTKLKYWGGQLKALSLIQWVRLYKSTLKIIRKPLKRSLKNVTMKATVNSPGTNNKQRVLEHKGPLKKSKYPSPTKKKMYSIKKARQVKRRSNLKICNQIGSFSLRANILSHPVIKGSTLSFFVLANYFKILLKSVFSEI